MAIMKKPVRFMRDKQGPKSQAEQEQEQRRKRQQGKPLLFEVMKKTGTRIPKWMLQKKAR